MLKKICAFLFVPGKSLGLQAGVLPIEPPLLVSCLNLGIFLSSPKSVSKNAPPNQALLSSSKDSSVGSALDWYLEGPGFKSRCLLLNFQLEKGCGRDSK